MKDTKKKKLIDIAGKTGFLEGAGLGFKFPISSLSNIQMALGISLAAGLITKQKHDRMGDTLKRSSKYILPMLAGSSIIGGLINRHKKKKLMEEIIEKQPNFPYDYVDAKSPGDTPAGRMILRERDNKILRKNYGLLHE